MLQIFAQNRRRIETGCIQYELSELNLVLKCKQWKVTEFYIPTKDNEYLVTANRTLQVNPRPV